MALLGWHERFELVHSFTAADETHRKQAAA